MSSAEDYLNSTADEFHIACLLLSPSGRTVLGTALDAVDPEDFYDAHLGTLWSAARTIQAKGQRITKRALLAEADGPAAKTRVDAISGEPVFPAKIPAAIKAVKENAQMRRLVQAAERIVQRAVAAEDYSQAYGAAWDELKALDGGTQAAEVVCFADLADEWAKSMVDGPTGSIVPTPWGDINEMFAGGLHSGRSYVVAGRPGDGKSNVALNIGAHAAQEGHPALVVSAEMGRLEVAGRVMAAGGKAEYGEIVTYSMSDDTQRRVTAYASAHRNMPLYVLDKSNLTVEYIAAVARTQKRTTGLDVLVVDYLQLLDSTDKQKVREQQVSHISRSLKQLARELDCVVVSAAQINRESAKTNRKPGLADLRESGAIEQDADTVILLHHELVEDQPTGFVTFIVAKNRYGRKGEVELKWRGHQARVSNSREF